MCFNNLPILFDDSGRARLDESRGFAVDTAPREAPAYVAPSEAKGKTFSIDPVTRVAGALAFHTTVDLEDRVVTSAHSQAVLFRGYELILRDREPEEAIHISSRACGVCGGVHSTASAMALEMAFGVVPPPLAIIARNLAEGAELLYDHCLHLFLLAGVDYSQQVVEQTSPGLWRRAQRTAAPNAGTHGLMTIADIMTGLNPLRGSLVTEALEVTRTGREIVSLVYGKYPHPSAIVPAGLGTSLDHATLNQVLSRMVRLLDYAKKVATLWDDLVEFFLEADPDYRLVGVRPANLISTGMWDDPRVYDATYANADAWGQRRLTTPGVVIDGELRTTNLRQINLGIEEFVDHSFYERWADDDEPGEAPDGAPLSPFHPWNKRTIPRPEATSWRDRYSWSTAPRWDREAMESGPLARQWITVAAGLVETEFIRTAPGRLEIVVPESSLPEMTITWRVPDTVNALERIRARATHVAYCLMAGYTYLLEAFDAFRSGETEMAAPYEVTDGVGVGFWEAGRGTLTHYATIEDGKLANYQILTPSTWMASPRDPWDLPGPYEEAVLNTPILEHTEDPDAFTGIDILRTIRSFDPCLPCAVHLHTGGGTIVRDATSCACGTS
ncbi:MAG: nickel-dependent hydrogenase large subunit [Nitriliruptorales bacterium]|nr:nickel-dependent hydrogenase large subunit [Nitriliruptorales bacterium]